MIVLVVCMHAAVTYSHLGSWYFMEDPKPDNLGTLFFFSYYQMGLQAFFMGLLFLIAGYFVPEACDRKGEGRFLRDRWVRLGIPSLFYMGFGMRWFRLALIFGNLIWMASVFAIAATHT